MIKVTKGATCPILATAYDENGVPIDLTLYAAEFAVKLKVSDPDPPLILLTNGAGVTYLDQGTNPGQLRVVIEKETTDTLSGGEYWCDLHISLASARYQVIANTRMVVTVPVNLLGGGSSTIPGQPSGFGHFVKKASAGTLAAGVPVYAVGYNLGFLLVEAAQHGVTPNAVGIMSTAATDTLSGYATAIGTISGVTTTGMAVGDRVFLGSSVFVLTRSPGRQELARVVAVGVIEVNVGETDVIKRLTPTTWANVDLLASDPVSPVVRDIWGRTDNRLALRGDDAATRYAWFTKGQVLAEQTAAIRYFAVDYINGLDTNLGYSDVNAATAGTVAIKTLTKLREIVPVFGQGQTIVILVGGNPSGADLQYLKPDGVTLDDLDLRLFGYRRVFARTTRGFVNDTADKTILGAAIGVTGPDAGGAWTCGAGSTTSNIVCASATLPAETSATCMRIRFTGNVTAALANQCRNIWFNDTGNIIPGRNLSNAPASGDTFYIERPGVSVNNINVNIQAGSGLGFGQSDRPVVMAGFRARQTDASPSVYNYTSNDISLSFMEADQFLSMRAMNFVQIDHQYVDEASATITTGMGVRHAQNRSIFIFGAARFVYTDSAVISANTAYSIANCVAYIVGRACYFAGRLTLNFCGTGQANTSGIFLYGADGVGQSARHVGVAATAAPLTFASTNGRISGVDVSAAGAFPAVNISSVGNGFLTFRTMTSRTGGNTDVGISLGTSGTVVPVGSRIDIGTTNTLTGTLGDFRLADGTIVSYATVLATRLVDNFGNSVGGLLGTDQPITRKTPGIFYNVPLQALDPTTPLAADLWTRTDNRMGLRGNDAVTRYTWFTQAQPIADYTQTYLTQRYFFIDPVSGLDTNIGFLDGALDATFTSGQRVGIPLRTYDEFLLRLEKHGAGRKIVLLVAPMADGSVLLNKLGTAQDVDLVGLTSYTKFQIRGSDLSNDTNDKTIGQATPFELPAGDPNGDGSWTITAVGAGYFDVAAGPTQACLGKRVRSVTGSTYTTPTSITVIVGNRVYVRSTSTPVIGDRIWIERPKVRFNRFNSSSLLLEDAPPITATPAAESLQLVGLDFASDLRARAVRGSTRLSFVCITGNVSILRGDIINFSTFWIDQTSAAAYTNRTTNAGVTVVGSTFTISNFAQILLAAGAITASISLSFIPRFNVNSGCALRGSMGLVSVGAAAGYGTTNAGNTFIGDTSVPPSISGQCTIRDSVLSFLGVVLLSNATAPIALNAKGSTLSIEGLTSPYGANADVVVDLTGSTASTLIFGRNAANTATATLGAIRKSDGTFIATFAELAGRTVIDAAGNRCIGTGVLAVQNEQQLAADPASPAIADNWWRTDNRIAVRGSDAVTRYAWFTKGQILADAQTAIRYYAVDYINGIDSRLGYSDVDAATAGTVAIKTLTKLREIVPVFGQGQVIVILVAGNPAGADLQYLKPDGITLDDLDLRLFGYRKVAVRSTRNFVNDTADKTILGAAIGVTGPDAGGVWTCGGGSTTSNIVSASATLPAETTATMMRVRFTGNVTAALANQCRNIWFNDTANIIPGLNLTNAPAAGDTFYIERPGVSVNNISINIIGGAGLNFNQAEPAAVVCGFRARQTDASPSTFNYNSNDIRLSFMEADQFLSVKNTGYFQVDSQYQDEASTPATITTGLGIRHAQNRSVICQGLTKVTYNESGIYSSNTNLNFSNCVSYVIGKACYFPRRLSLLFCGTGAANAPGIFLFGSAGIGQPSRHVNAAAGIPLVITSTNGRIDGVDISNAAANPCMAIASVGQALLSFRNVTSRAGGNTGVVLSCGEAGFALPVSSRIDFATTVGSIATAGDLKIGDASIVTFASVQASRVIDIWGNDYGGVLGTDQPITRKTPGIAFREPVLGADPATPEDGDRWVTDIAGVRNICVRIGGATYRSLLT